MKICNSKFNTEATEVNGNVYTVAVGVQEGSNFKSNQIKPIWRLKGDMRES